MGFRGRISNAPEMRRRRIGSSPLRRALAAFHLGRISKAIQNGNYRNEKYIAIGRRNTKESTAFADCKCRDRGNLVRCDVRSSPIQRRGGSNGQLRQIAEPYFISGDRAQWKCAQWSGK